MKRAVEIKELFSSKNAIVATERWATLDEWMDEAEPKIRQTRYGWGGQDAVKHCLRAEKSERYYKKHPEQLEKHTALCKEVCPLEVPHAIAGFLAETGFYGSYELQILLHPLKVMILRTKNDLCAFVSLIYQIAVPFAGDAMKMLKEVPLRMRATLAALVYKELEFLIIEEDRLK
jgi:hypothetical protein